MLWPGESVLGRTSPCCGWGLSGVSSFRGALGASALGVGVEGCGSAGATFVLGVGALGNSFGFSGCSVGAGAGWTGGAISRRMRGSTCTLGGGGSGCAGGL